MQNVRRIALAGFLMALLLVTSVQAQVTQYIPSHALVVFKINKLDATSQKVAAFINQMGLAQMDPRLADPLGSIQTEMGVTKGINKDGDLALAFMKPQEAVEPATTDTSSDDVADVEKEEEEAVLLLIPVSDYDQFLGNFSEPKTEGDITEVILPDSEKTSYVVHWGEYAALSPSKSLVSTAPDGIVLQGLAATEFASKDAVIWANLPALREIALPKLQENREKILNKVSAELSRKADANPAVTQLAKSVVNQLLNAAEEFLKDGQAATYSLNFGEQGINTTLMTEFAPDSKIGQTVAKVQNSDQNLMAGLPDESYIVMGGLVVDNELVSKLMSDVVDPILQETAALEEQGKPISNYIDALKRALTATRSETFGLIAPTAAIGQGSLIQGLAIATGDAHAIATAQKDMFDSQAEMTKLFGADETAIPQTTYTENAKTVDGVALNQFQTKFNPNPKTPQERQIAQLMALMYGPEGINGYVGVLDENHLLVVSGLTDTQIKQSIDSAKAGLPAVAQREHVAAVTRELPQNRIGEAYVSLDVLLSTAANYAKQFGAAFPLNLQPNLPPIGVTLATEGSAVRIDSHVPTQLVHQLVTAGMQVFMGMQGGGAGEGAQPGEPDGM